MAATYPLILGASGLAGTEVVKLLSRVKVNVRVSYREQSDLNILRNFGVEPIYADFTDKESLQSAMKDVSAVALILPVNEHMTEWGRNVVDCAKTAGVQKLVFLTNLCADPESSCNIPRMHGEVDAYIRTSGVPYHIIHSAPHFQNIFWSVITIVRHRQFGLPLDAAEIPYIDLFDCAVFIAKILCEEHAPNKDYTITGPQAYSMFRIARRLSQSLGHDIRYTPIPLENGESTFRSMGMTSWLAHNIADVYTEYATGKYNKVTKDFELIAGRPPTGLDKFIERNLAVFRQDSLPDRLTHEA